LWNGEILYKPNREPKTINNKRIQTDIRTTIVDLRTSIYERQTPPISYNRIERYLFRRIEGRTGREWKEGGIERERERGDGER